ncbi:MAG: HD domain-containing phosphohydrolase [Gemmatimonadota bacterium]
MTSDGTRLSEPLGALSLATDLAVGPAPGSALASRGSQALGMPTCADDSVRLAGLLHDIGRVAVPNGLWDKPGPFTPSERRQMETQTYHTSQILTRCASFQPLADQASGTHERCDGSGYHRRIQLDDPDTALLAAAQMYDTLRHHRPWRPAHGEDEAEGLMRAEVSAGRLPHRVVHAALDVAGQMGKMARSSLTAGLTPREADVVALLAAGCSDKAIARRLGISVKTAGRHVGRIYKKTGKRGRAQIAFFAMDHKALLA